MFEFDLADRVDDLICVFEGGNPDSDMDTISMLLTGWIIFLFLAVAGIKFLYVRFSRPSPIQAQNEGAKPDVEEKSYSESSDPNQSNSSGLPGPVPPTSPVRKSGNDDEPPTAELRKRKNKKDINAMNGSGGVKPDIVLVGAGTSFSRQQPTVFSGENDEGPCLGPDPLINEYLNGVFKWIYSPRSVSDGTWDEAVQILMDSLNHSLKDSGGKKRLTCDCETSLNGVLSFYSKVKGAAARSDFFVDTLNGRLNISFDGAEKKANMKFDGWPDVAVSIPHTTTLDKEGNEALIEGVTAAIRNAVLSIDLNLFPTFPLIPKITPLSRRRSSHGKEKKYLIVKVVGGRDIGLQKGCEEPYCVLELDDPPQKYQTEPMKGKNPQWKDNFVFNIRGGTGEILFEVYDQIGARFLGCNILSVDEIGVEGNPRLIPLKSRRMEISEQITGTIELQFTFLDEAEFMQKSREIIEQISPNGNLIKTTRTVFTKSPTAGSGLFTEGVLKEFDAISNADKSTLIIHSVQKTEKIAEQIIIGKDNEGLNKGDKDQSSAGMDHQYGEERGRRKTRKGDIFKTIKRRFSKGRSQSMVTSKEDGGTESEPEFSRSISEDRQSLLTGRHLSVGGSGMSSARSSASELSGFSTTTFIHENSTLVIEATENRVKKYYLIPPHLAESGKWRKRGKKLHIFNDHTFGAKHLPSGSSCDICSGRFPFSLGKQGYECRDCKLKCHKECHVRVTSYCANTTVYDIELDTAKSEKGSNLLAFLPSFFQRKKTNNGHVTHEGETVRNGKINKANGSALQKLPYTSNKKKPSNIFKKAPKLGKISEEPGEVKMEEESEGITLPPKCAEEPPLGSDNK